MITPVVQIIAPPPELDGSGGDHLAAVLTGVLAERIRQDEQWGGPDHDDAHPPHVWERLIIEHAYRLTDRIMDEHGQPAPDYRQRLVKVAALAVAAIQTWDRRTQPGEAGEVLDHGAWADDTLAACAEGRVPAWPPAKIREG